MNLRTHKNPMYRIWQNMKNRCLRPNVPAYPRYGGRGITVCKDWMDFDRFCADVGPRPEGGTLERKDNAGSYSPENCCWATAKEQARNRRSNTTATFNGQPMTLAEAAERAGLTSAGAVYRLEQGIPMERPVRHIRQAQMITHAGRTMTLGEWSAESGVHKTTLHMRIHKYGWPVERALQRPKS